MRYETSAYNKRPNGEAGFSAAELMVVATIVIVLSVIAVFALRPTKRNYSADDGAELITNYLRDAYHRALAQRQTIRVDIDIPNQWVILVDENKLPVGDEIEIKRERLVSPVSMNRPSSGGAPIALPPAPYAYNPAVFNSSGIWSARFRSDGSIVDAAGNPESATLYFSPDQVTAKEMGLVRALTVFGPSGAIRKWYFDASNSTFVAGGK